MVALNLSDKAFIVHVVFIASSDFASSDPNVYPSRWAQIAFLKADETLIAILSKYTNFIDIFFPNLIVELLEHTKINNYAIELIDSKQPSYRTIYSLRLIKLETLKTYIKINLANNFIRPFKFLVDILIFFAQKSNSSLCLCVNYQSLNNQTIKNWYLLLSIGESLDGLD